MQTLSPCREPYGRRRAAPTGEIHRCTKEVIIVNRMASTITRVEIAESVHAAFQSGPAHRDDLLVVAVRNRARPVVIALLHDLPPRSFADLRQLWEVLPDVPVEDSSVDA